jgi:hypothetical protein
VVSDVEPPAPDELLPVPAPPTPCVPAPDDPPPQFVPLSPVAGLPAPGWPDPPPCVVMAGSVGCVGGLLGSVVLPLDDEPDVVPPVGTISSPATMGFVGSRLLDPPRTPLAGLAAGSGDGAAEPPAPVPLLLPVPVPLPVPVEPLDPMPPVVPVPVPVLPAAPEEPAPASEPVVPEPVAPVAPVLELPVPPAVEPVPAPVVPVPPVMPDVPAAPDVVSCASRSPQPTSAATATAMANGAVLNFLVFM